MNRRGVDHPTTSLRPKLSRDDRRRVQRGYAARILIAAMLPAGGLVQRQAASAHEASPPPVTTPLPAGFTQKTSVRPSTLFLGAPIVISVATTATGAALTNGIVAITIYNSDNRQVGGHRWTQQALHVKQTVTHTYKWTARAAGTYRVAVGLFGPRGTPIYLRVTTAARFTVSKVRKGSIATRTPARARPSRTKTPPSLTPTALPTARRILGFTATTGGQFDTGNNNNLSAVRVMTAGAGASVRAISVYVGPIDTKNPAYGLAVYTDRDGSPYARTASASGTLTRSGWNTLPVTAVLAPNTAYWLVYNSATSHDRLDEVYFVPGAANTGGWSPPVRCCVFPATQRGWTVTNMQFAIFATLAGLRAGEPHTATGTAIPPTPTSTAMPGPSATPSAHQVFDDEFTGPTLDTNTWSVLNRPGDASNAEQECYLPSNAAIESGALVLTDRQDSSCDGYQYTSAMVQTKSFNFTYGTLEVRAWLPAGTGQWPAIWLLGANCQATNPTTPDNTDACQWPSPGSNEIDLFEGKNSLTTTGFFSLVSGPVPNDNDYGFACRDVALDVDISSGYHTYKLIWQPNSLAWQIDGRTYCSTSAHVPSTAMFIILNVALGGSFTGSAIDSSILPRTMHIDYVRVDQG